MNLINISIPGKETNVPIYVGKDLVRKIKPEISFDEYSSFFAIIDENAMKHWEEKIDGFLLRDTRSIIIPSGESNKTLATVEKILLELSQKGADRKSLILNIGGGMVCDIGAFAASVYMRGISFMQIPTTLLAQTDAAIGGKTGFNFNGLKNTIGTFYLPRAILIDTQFLTTLPPREYHSGYAEIIKYALIADSALFHYLLADFPGEHDDKQLGKILLQSCKIKSSIVRKDFFDQGERKKLNFGHTVGHAIEMACSESANPLLHGEAVALGMLAEARMSVVSGYISERKFKDIENLIKKAKLPTRVNSSFKAEISRKMLFDKKNIRQHIHWVFLEDIGRSKIDVTLNDDVINEGLNYIMN